VAEIGAARRPPDAVPVQVDEIGAAPRPPDAVPVQEDEIGAAPASAPPVMSAR
jgi:hypothetical protein